VSSAAAAAGGISGITDIRITACPEDNCVVPGFRKIPQDLNKYSRGSFVHLHFTDDEYQPDAEKESDSIFLLDNNTAQEHYKRGPRRGGRRQHPITEIAVRPGPDAYMGPEWERLEGNLNDGNRGPVLTMFVKRDPSQHPVDSIVVKYGYDSHAAIGYDRLPMDLNTGTGKDRLRQNLTKERARKWGQVGYRMIIHMCSHPLFVCLFVVCLPNLVTRRSMGLLVLQKIRTSPTYHTYRH
jgi:hypothetical protein